jgi:hypothetical protein
MSGVAIAVFEIFPPGRDTDFCQDWLLVEDVEVCRRHAEYLHTGFLHTATKTPRDLFKQSDRAGGESVPRKAVPFGLACWARLRIFCLEAASGTFGE